MPDSVAVAVLTRLDALAARHGLRPYDFVARVTTRSAHGQQRWEVEFDAPPRHPVQAERFRRLLAAIGIVRPGPAVVFGGVESLLDALDAALGVTPPTVRRGENGPDLEPLAESMYSPG